LLVQRFAAELQVSSRQPASQDRHSASQGWGGDGKRIGQQLLLWSLAYHGICGSRQLRLLAYTVVDDPPQQPRVYSGGGSCSHVLKVCGVSMAGDVRVVVSGQCTATGDWNAGQPTGCHSLTDSGRTDGLVSSAWPSFVLRVLLCRASCCRLWTSMAKGLWHRITDYSQHCSACRPCGLL
jgi:hypothetical protein